MLEERKIAVVGSRRRLDKEKVYALIESLNKTDTVISGGCEGVDTWAIEKAQELGLNYQVITPSLRGLTDYFEICEAYYRRNKFIADNCDIMYAFVAKDRKGGTENSIKWAKQLKKKVIIK